MQLSQWGRGAPGAVRPTRVWIQRPQTEGALTPVSRRTSPESRQRISIARCLEYLRVVLFLSGLSIQWLVKPRKTLQLLRFSTHMRYQKLDRCFVPANLIFFWFGFKAHPPQVLCRGRGPDKRNVRLVSGSASHVSQPRRDDSVISFFLYTTLGIKKKKGYETKRIPTKNNQGREKENSDSTRDGKATAKQMRARTEGQGTKPDD